MAGGASVSAVTSQLREHYTGDKPVEIFYKSSKDLNPAMACMEAVADDGEGMGSKLVTKIIYGHGSTGGQDFTKVQNKSKTATTGASALYSRWETQPQEVQGIARWSRAAMDRAVRKGSAELFDVMTTEMDTKIALIRRLIATYALGNGIGDLAQILTVSSAGFTVAPALTNQFFEGMNISACATQTGATLNSDESLLCTGTDPDTGTVYLSTDCSSSSGRTAWAANHYVYNTNDRPATDIAAYSARVLMHGMTAMLPGPTVVDSTPWDGVTRNGSPALAGHTINCAGMEPENAFLGAVGRLFAHGSASNRGMLCICSPSDYVNYAAQKDKAKHVEVSLGKYNVGYSGIMLDTLAGSVPLIPDAFCKAGTFFAGPWNDKEYAPKLVYVNELVNIDDKDGNMFTRDATATDFEMRLYTSGNIILPAPARFIRGYGLSIS